MTFEDKKQLYIDIYTKRLEDEKREMERIRLGFTRQNLERVQYEHELALFEDKTLKAMLSTIGSV